MKTVSGMLGHFSAGFTLDTYAHVTTVAQRDAAQKMDGLLGSRICPRFRPNQNGSNLGQLPKESKKPPRSCKAQGWFFLVNFSGKNSTFYTTDTTELRECAGSIPQKCKRKPQVIKPGVFGWSGHFRLTLQMTLFSTEVLTMKPKVWL